MKTAKINQIILSLSLGLLMSNFSTSAIPSLFYQSDKVDDLMKQLDTVSVLVSNETTGAASETRISAGQTTGATIKDINVPINDIYKGNIYYKPTTVSDESLIAKSNEKYQSLESLGEPAFDILYWDPVLRQIFSFVKKNAADSKVLQAAWNDCMKINRLIRGIVKYANAAATQNATRKQKNNYFRDIAKQINTQIYPESRSKINDINNTRFYLAGTKASRDLILKLQARLMATLNRILDNYNYHEKQEDAAAKPAGDVAPKNVITTKIDPFVEELKKKQGARAASTSPELSEEEQKAAH